MTCIDTKPKRHLSAKLVTGLAIAAVLALGAGIGSARADDRDRDRHDDYQRGHYEHHEAHWNGGYYRAPPVVYAEPGYYRAPPPVYYGSGVGISLPGVNFNFR
jgi:hypothetical protein